jgi:hypothetical protein
MTRGAEGVKEISSSLARKFKEPLERMSDEIKIIKGVPIPSNLRMAGGVAGHTPKYPFRDMDAGDYIEILLDEMGKKAEILTALRNCRKSRPAWVFVYEFGDSVEKKNNGKGHVFVKIWRKK